MKIEEMIKLWFLLGEIKSGCYGFLEKMVRGCFLICLINKSVHILYVFLINYPLSMLSGDNIVINLVETFRIWCYDNSKFVNIFELCFLEEVYAWS